MTLYSPPMLGRPGEVTITPWSFQSLVVEFLSARIIDPQGQNFVTANLAVFIPFCVPEAVVITRLGWGNGSPVTGNLDAGLYTPAGVLLGSTGSTAQVTTNTLQSVDITDVVLGRGLYYLALASDTSGTTQKVVSALPAAGILQGFGLLQQATAFPLATNASPATFAIYASAFVPLVMAQGYRAVTP